VYRDLIEYEEYGCETDEDLLRYAQLILQSGLHRSAGRYGRVVAQACEVFGPETVYMDGELYVG
jgi:hypothetical protein